MENELHPIQQKLLRLARVRKLSLLSYREIGRQISDDTERIHPQLVKYHLDRLTRAQKILQSDRPTNPSPRAAKSSHTALIRIPIMGSVNAGPATMIADDSVEDFVHVSSNLLRTKNYQDLIALRITGDSMNQAMIAGSKIEENDLVIVDRTKRSPKDREIVIVNSDGLVNIKRIYFDSENRQIVLRSESTEMYAPIFLSVEDDLEPLIEGTVLQVLKNSK